MRVVKKRLISLGAVVLIALFAGQLVALTALVADNANAGPRIAIVKLTNNEDVEWAKEDLLTRLSPYITDDPFIMNRLAVYDISSKDQLSRVDGDIIIYLSHGGTKGLLVGDALMTWPEMAEFVMKSDAPLHLFAACKSKEIIKFGDDNSGKHLYTVNGVRAAEITDVEITTVVLMALGFDQDYASAYRTSELLKVKDLLESGESYHPMAFDDIVLYDIGAMNTEYSTMEYNVLHDPHDDDVWVDQFFELSHLDRNSPLPSEIQDLLNGYFPYGTPQEVDIVLNATYYTHYTYSSSTDWYVDDVAEEDVPVSCSYYGTISYQEGNIVLSASGTRSGYESPEFELAAITLSEVGDGGIVVSHAKTDGVWSEPEVSRNSTRTGGSYFDSCSTVNYNQSWDSPLDGWQYQKMHTILAGSGAGTNYQVHFTMHYGSGPDLEGDVFLNGHCKPDFSDVRFTSSDGITMLDYWCQDYVSGDYADFWVEVKDSLDYDRTIYLFYGNENAASTSDGDATFVFFDDFLGTHLDTSKWSHCGDPDTYSVGNGLFTQPNDNAWLQGIGSKSAWDMQGGYRVVASAYSPWPTSSYGYLFHLTLDDAASSEAYNFVYDNNVDIGLRRHSDGTQKIGYGLDGAFSLADIQWVGERHVLSVATYPGGSQYWCDSAQLATLGATTASTFHIYLTGNGPSVPWDVDWVFMAKYSPTEPGHGLWGAEETLLKTSDWIYRQSHTITHGFLVGNNYQIRLTAHYGTGTDSGENFYLNAHCKPDFSDLRFASENGVSPLDYWVESYSQGNQATIWLEVRNSLDYDRTIYIYYGNDNAQSASNGDATFIFFDDFDDGTINTAKWDISQSPAESGGLLTTYSSTTGEGVKTDATFQYGRFHMRGLLGYAIYNWDGRAGFGNSMSGSDLQGASFWTVNSGLTRTITGDASSITSTDIGDFDSAYHIWDIVWYSGAAKFYVDGVLKATHTTHLPTSATNILLESYRSLTTCHFDYVFLSKAVATEPTHGSWGAEENSAVFESSGDYLYVSLIPVGNGWHGPDVTKTLPSAFTIEQMDTFSVDLSLFHAGIGDRESKTSVNLFDEYGDIAFKLEIMDDTTAASQKVSVVYYGTSGSGDPTGTFETGYLSGDYTGTASIRYDPHQGLIAKVSGYNEDVFTASVDSNRLITSMTIESLRNGNHAQHDGRIDNIMVSYAFSEYTIFDEDCSSMDGFQKNLDVSNLIMPISDGSIISTNNYLTLTSVAGGGDWHGPAYVKALDRPFRLYQLAEFSINAELLAGTTAQGMIQVALFDEAMHLVLDIMVDDSSSSATGRMTICYWPTTSGWNSVGWDSGYTSGDINKVGKIWFDGSNVQSYIEGAGTQMLYSSSLDPDAIIKYLVVYGAGYESMPLSDMRVHGIHIEVDVNAVAPGGGGSEPVTYDGTKQGITTESDEQTADGLMQEAQTQVEAYWTFEPWPWFHVKRPAQNGDNTQFHVKKDLLGNVEVLEFGVCSQAQEEPPNWDGTMQVLQEILFDGIFAYLATFVASQWLLFEKTGSLLSFAAALTGTIALVIAPTLTISYFVDNGWWSPSESGALLFILGAVVLFTAWSCGTVLESIFSVLYLGFLSIWSGIACPVLAIGSLLCKGSILAFLALTVIGLAFIMMGIYAWFTNTLPW